MASIGTWTVGCKRRWIRTSLSWTSLIWPTQCASAPRTFMPAVGVEKPLFMVVSSLGAPLYHGLGTARTARWSLQPYAPNLSVVYSWSASLFNRRMTRITQWPIMDYG